MPLPSSPLVRLASPVTSVRFSGDWVVTRKCENSFHEPWNDRIVSVIRAGRAIGSTTDQKVRKTLAPSIRAASSIETGTESKNCFMMKTPAASTISGRIMAV